MGGNMTGAVKKIEKIKKGLSDDPKVKAALRKANESINEKISKEEWARYPKYARKLKPYMQRLLNVPLKVKVIKQANENPWIGVRVARFGKDIIPNDFRVKVAKSIGAKSVRDWDNVNYGGIRVNSIDLRYDQWVKLLGNKVKESINESDLGLTYKKGKTITVTHKKSGKELVIIDKPNVRKEYEKIGFYAESIKEGTFGKYDTGAAFKGNGLTIYDRNQSQGGDFKNIAHISEDGKLTIWDKNIKKEHKLMQSLKKISQEFKTSFKESVNEEEKKWTDYGNHFKQLSLGFKQVPFWKKLNKNQKEAISIALIMGGNMTGAVEEIEKIKKGLSKDKKVKNALRVANESIDETKERDYKAEYKKYGSSTKAKKYRAELNQYNRKKGTYGNGDGKDASHKGGKIVGFEKESTNRGRAEKSRLKKEDIREDIGIETYLGGILKSMKKAGLKLKSAQVMKWGWSKSKDKIGFLITVLDREREKYTLQIEVDRDGNLWYLSAQKDMKLGKWADTNKIVRSLKAISKLPDFGQSTLKRR